MKKNKTVSLTVFICVTTNYYQEYRQTRLEAKQTIPRIVLMDIYNLIPRILGSNDNNVFQFNKIFKCQALVC